MHFQQNLVHVLLSLSNKIEHMIQIYLFDTCFALDISTLRPMPHFQPAVDYLLEQFPQMVLGYIKDYSYQMATVLDPQYGPAWFRDFSGGKLLSLLQILPFFFAFPGFTLQHLLIECSYFCFTLKDHSGGPQRTCFH